MMNLSARDTKYSFIHFVDNEMWCKDMEKLLRNGELIRIMVFEPVL